jgi:putative endonuclease
LVEQRTENPCVGGSIPSRTTKAAYSSLFYYMHFVYIIYSATTDKYYVGETVDIDLRLQQHHQSFFKGASTTFAKDWELKLLIKLKDRLEARKIESYIKAMKSKKFIEQLIRDSDFYEKFKSLVRQKLGIEII